MPEKGTTKRVGDAAVALNLGYIERIPTTYIGKKSILTTEDRSNAGAEATAEVKGYSKEQLAGDPKIGAQIVEDVTRANLTRRLYEKEREQMHRAQEGR